MIDREFIEKVNMLLPYGILPIRDIRMAIPDNILKGNAGLAVAIYILFMDKSDIIFCASDDEISEWQNKLPKFIAVKIVEKLRPPNEPALSYYPNGELS